MVLFSILTLAAVALVVAIIVTLWKLGKTVDRLASRLDESLRQLELMAEEVRKTSVVALEILNRAERAAGNVEHVTEGLRGFRKTLDAATAVLDFAVVPVLGNVAGGVAGVKAAVSTVVNRLFRKEDGHE
jgi:uncharacterized protein YoxC